MTCFPSGETWDMNPNLLTVGSEVRGPASSLKEAQRSTSRLVMVMSFEIETTA